MDIGQDIEDQLFTAQVRSTEIEMSALRDKLWREGKIRIEGYTYSEWKERYSVK